MKGVTTYQLEVLQRIHEVRKETGKDADLDQLLDKFSWSPSKESAQFTIRAVVNKGLVVKTALQFRRGRKRVCFQLTPAGAGYLDPRAGVVEEKPVEASSGASPNLLDMEMEMLLSPTPELPEGEEILED